MLIPQMLSVVHSCSAGGLPLGVDYVTRPAAGVGGKEEEGTRSEAGCGNLSSKLWNKNTSLLLK